MAMEIRLLYGNELQQAVFTAQEVFEACVRPQIRSQQEADYFYQYVRVDRLWQEMSTGSLFLWGAFEAGLMCAVGAIRNNGQITMLYVRPQQLKRRIGVQLLQTMSTYAANVLGRDRVTINVSPVSAASYFYHIGFTFIQGSMPTSSYVSLERRIWSIPQGYPTGGYVMPAGGVPAGTGYGAWNGAAGYREQPQGQGNGAAVTGYEDAGGWPESSRGYVPYGFAGGPAYGPQYRYQMYPETVPVKAEEVTYPVRTVPVKRLIAMISCVLVLCFSVMTGVTIYHISVDGLLTGDGMTEDSTEQNEMIDELGHGEEI